MCTGLDSIQHCLIMANCHGCRYQYFVFGSRASFQVNSMPGHARLFLFVDNEKLHFNTLQVTMNQYYPTKLTEISFAFNYHAYFKTYWNEIWYSYLCEVTKQKTFLRCLLKVRIEMGYIRNRLIASCFVALFQLFHRFRGWKVVIHVLRLLSSLCEKQGFCTKIHTLHCSTRSGVWIFLCSQWSFIWFSEILLWLSQAQIVREKRRHCYITWIEFHCQCRWEKSFCNSCKLVEELLSESTVVSIWFHWFFIKQWCNLYLLW